MREWVVTPEIRRKIYERMGIGELFGRIATKGFLGYAVEKFKIRLYDDLFYVRAVVSNPIRNILSFANEDYSYPCAYALCGRYRQHGFYLCSSHLLEAITGTLNSELERDTRRGIYEILSKEEKKEITENIDDIMSVMGEGTWKVTLQLVWCSLSVPEKNGVEKPSESDWERKMKLKIPLAEKDLL